MTFEVALQWAKEYYHNMGAGVGSAIDDGEFYVFWPDQELSIGSAFAVNKESGEKVMYFPPDHLQAFTNAKGISISG